MPMPASPHAAPPRPVGRVRPADLALTESSEWSPDSPATRPRDAPSADRSHPALAICAALMAVALMLMALDPSLRADATGAPSCVDALHRVPVGQGAQGSGPPRRGRLIDVP